MGGPVPPANIPFLSSDNAGWLLTIVIVGVIVGSLATWLLKTPFLWSAVLGVVLTMVTALILDAAGINLPFEAWMRDFFNDTIGGLQRFFSGLTRR